MNMKVFLFVVVLGACTQDEGAVGGNRLASYSGPVDLYLIAGQSNAVGGANVSELSMANEGYIDAYPAVQQAYEINCPKDFLGGACSSSQGWADLAPRDGGANDYIGIEVSAGRELDDLFGEVAVLKHATNGSNLVTHWDTATDNSLYEYLVTFTNTELALLPTGSRVAGMFWIQGNGDAANSTFSGDYAENLGWLILRLREQYGCVPVVIDRLHPDYVATYADVVRSEQDEVVAHADDVVLVETDDLDLKSDLTHYTADSFIELGLRMADAMAACP